MITEQQKADVLAALTATDTSLAAASITPAERDPITADVQAARDKVNALPVEPPPPSTDLLAGDFSTAQGELWTNGTNFSVLTLNQSYQCYAEPEPGMPNQNTQHVCFKITQHALGKAPSIQVRFTDAALGSKIRLDVTYKAWFSYDRVTWALCPSAVYNGSPDILTIQCPTFTEDAVWISTVIPHSYPDLLAQLAAWQAEAGTYCTATQIGTSVQGRPITRLTLTDPAVPDAGKTRVYVARSGHVDEHHATYRLLGMVNEILANPGLLARNIWEIVPCSNPDGLVLGYMRVTAAGVEQNRWEPTAAQTLAVKGPEAGAIHADVEALVAATPTLAAYFDLHVSLVTDEGEECSRPPTAPPAWDSLTDDIAFFDAPAGNLMKDAVTADEAWMLDTFSHRRLFQQYGATGPRCYIWENGYSRHQNAAVPTIASMQALGALFAKAIDRDLHS